LKFKSFQTLTGPKRTFLNSKGLKKGTFFFIGTSPDLKWISNENSEKFLGLEFNRISSCTFKFG
jgi:hypothetical protein